MGNTLVRLERDNTEYFLQWSSVSDGPSFGMSESELREYYQDEYGRRGCEDLDARIAECRKRGTSSRMYKTGAEVIYGNRAGKDETELTADQIIDAYCLSEAGASNDTLPLGFKRDENGNILTLEEYEAWCDAQERAYMASPEYQADQERARKFAESNAGENTTWRGVRTYK